MGKPSNPSLTEAELAARAKAIRDRIAAGRSSAALKDAKELARLHKGPLTDAVLADAYDARFQDLSLARQDKEAAELLVVAAARLPAMAERWQALRRSQKLRTGDLTGLLAVLCDPEARVEDRAVAEAELQRELVDPRVLLHAGLPSDHELFLAASAVTAAFEEAAAGSLRESTRDRLRCVARRSPLSPWRSFVLALEAYHRGADAEALRWLERIPADAAPAPFVAVLMESLVGLPPTTELGRLLDAGVTRARQLAVELSRAIQEAQKAQIQKLSADLLCSLYPLEPRLAARFLRFLNQQSEAEVQTGASLLAAAERLFADGELSRLYAADHLESDPLSAIPQCSLWLCKDHGRKLRPLSDADLARVLDRMVHPVHLAFVEIQDLLESHNLPVRGCLQGPVAMHLGRTLYELHGPGSDGEAIADALIALAKLNGALWDRLEALTSDQIAHERLLHKLRQRDEPAVQWLFAACLLDPSTKRYQRLLDLVRKFRPSGTEPMVVQHWIAHLPSAEAHVELARLHLAGGALDEAAQAIEEALQMDPLHQGARALLVPIAARRIRTALQRADMAAALAHLGRLASMPVARGGPIREWCQTATGLLQENGAVDAEIRAFVAADLGLLVPAQGAVDADGGPALLAVPAVDLKTRLRILLRWLALDDAMDSGLKERIDEGPLDGITAAHLPPAAEELGRLCRYLEAKGRHQELYLASGVGIGADHNLLPYFLCCRMVAVARVRGAAAAKDLASLAYSAAVQRGQPEVFRRYEEDAPGLLCHLWPTETLDPLQFRSELDRERQRGLDLSGRLDPRPPATGTERLEVGEDGTGQESAP